MNKDRVEGKVKDIGGRIERQAGEWTGDPKKQISGAARQAEGKLQNAWGKAKDAAQDAAGEVKSPSKPPRRAQDDENEGDDEESVNR